MFVTRPFLDFKFLFQHELEWQAQHSPILLSPDSIASMLRNRYSVFSVPAMHSLEANEGRSEETEEEVQGDRYEEGDEIANFLLVAVRTVAVVELVPQQMAPQKTVQGLSHQLVAQKTVQGLIPRRESLLKV